MKTPSASFQLRNIIAPLQLLLAVSCILLAGCKPKPTVSTATQNPYTALAISNLINRVSALDQRVSTLEDNKRAWVSIDPDSQSYEKLWTPFGALLVSTKNVTPYLDGYKVKVAIGNPYNVAFSGFQLEYWCDKKKFTLREAKTPFTPPLPSDIETDVFGGVRVTPPKTEKLPDFGSLRTVNVEDRTETIYPGSWNEIEFTVAPATADDIRHLRMSIDLNEIHLRDVPTPN